MKMRRKVLASMLFAFLPWLAMAQSTDDLYFIPKKEKKTEASQKVGVVPKEVSNKTVNELPSNTAIVVKDVKGNVRDVDEYNRRYTSRDNTFTYENDTLYIEEKPYGERGEWVNGFQGSDMDYEYAMRLIRFRNPRYAIPISSPLYWDVVYGAFPSWDWNVYDDGMYAYIFPTYTNRLWWDWRWSYGFYGPGWGFGWGWHSPWYSPWYYGGWYSPWYAGYWGGYWGPGWHHHYPYYGWNSGWYRSGHTDYRAGRYQSYNRGNSISGTGTSYTRRTQSSSAIATNRANTAAKRSSIGRVVTGSSTRGDATQSVRPGRTAIRNQGVTTGTGTGTRVNSGNTYTRPSTGTYTRRSTTNVDRTGSNYNRPSSTRRSSNYYNNSNTRSTYQRSNTSTSGSSFNRSSSSYSRSSGGSVTRSSGGSSRRR